MIQKTYKIEIEIMQEGMLAWLRLQKLARDIRAMAEYGRASGVLVKLLMERIPDAQAAKAHEMVRRELPKAIVTGMSMTAFGFGEGGHSCTLHVCFFERAHIALLEHVSCPECYVSVGTRIGRQIAAMEYVRGVELFCAGLKVDMSRFIDALAAENEDIPFFGALAGVFSQEGAGTDAEVQNIFRIEEGVSNYVFGSGLHNTGVVLIAYCGEDLAVQADYLLGWKPVGKELLVTERLSDTCVAKLDGISAVDIYRRYLGVVPGELFLENICEFPFVVERNGCLMARVPPSYDAEGRLYFTADIKPEEKLRLTYGNPLEILAETEERSEAMCDFGPEAVFLIVCGNRTLFLKEDAPREIESYGRLCPELLASYGKGEIYKHKGKGGVLNSALIAVGMREGGWKVPAVCAGEAEDLPQRPADRVIPLSTRMATFLNATTRELEASNRGLKEMAEKAKAASVAKSQFLSNMSHEIRTPINAILGMDEMILRECKDKEILEYAENIRLAGANLLGLVNDILDFSKIEAGKMDIVPVEYALSSVLNDLVNMIQKRAEKKGLALHVNAVPELPSILFGDEIRIKQVITNILTNAVKYTEKGSVTLKVDYEKQGERDISLRVSVKDTGIGIREQDMKKLFAAFERIEEARNRTVEGTGLGMNITQKLLALMGSRLEVESRYGEGSEFSFAIRQKVMNWEPMGDFEESYRRTLAGHQAYHEPFTAPEAKILVVDDTVMNLTVVKGLLKQTKVRIDTAESGYECLHLATKEHYDIIFLDHRMPGIDGIETLARMKKLPHNLNQDTPVISLTANAVSGARTLYLDAGFTDYLTKPINSAHLEAMMLKYLPPEKVTLGAAAEAPEAEAALPAWLLAADCIDAAAGVKNCGSPAAYLDALTVFAESVASGADEIERYWQASDWQNYTTKVHALKSTARVIGAAELSEKARRLEDAGNGGYIEEIEQGTPALLALYRSYIGRLAPLAAPEEEDADEKPLIDAADLAEAYETLKEVAASFDYDSLQFVLKSLADYRLPAGEAAHWQGIRAAAAKPDWERLKTLLA